MLPETGRYDDPIRLSEPEAQRRDLQNSGGPERTRLAVPARAAEKEPESCHSSHAAKRIR